jgi:hypothetical protein
MEALTTYLRLVSAEVNGHAVESTEVRT